MSLAQQMHVDIQLCTSWGGLISAIRALQGISEHPLTCSSPLGHMHDAEGKCTRSHTHLAG